MSASKFLCNTRISISKRMIVIAVIFSLVCHVYYAQSLGGVEIILPPSHGDDSNSSTIILPPAMERRSYQWAFFQFHSDEMCTSFIDYVHGVRLGECQSDKRFLLFWNNVSTPFAASSSVSYRLFGNNSDSASTFMSIVWMETYESDDCSGTMTQSMAWITDICEKTLPDTVFGRYGRTVMLKVIEDYQSPQIIRSQTLSNELLIIMKHHNRRL